MTDVSGFSLRNELDSVLRAARGFMDGERRLLTVMPCSDGLPKSIEDLDPQLCREFLRDIGPRGVEFLPSGELERLRRRANAATSISLQG